MRKPEAIRLKPVCSPAHQCFFHAAKSVLRDGYFIHSCVSLTDFLAVEPGSTALSRSRLNSLKVDFVIFDPDFKPIATLDLDSATEARSARETQLHQIKMKLLASAGLSLVLAPCASQYDCAAIRALLPNFVLRSIGASSKKQWARFPFHGKYNPRRPERTC